MTQLTKNFTLEEFEHSDTAIKLGIDNSIRPSQPEIVSNLLYLCEKLLQPIRDKIGTPIRINSGYRCSNLNEVLKGSKISQHMKGQAADIVCNDMNKLYLIAKEMEFDQMIVYTKRRFIHLSITKVINRNELLFNNN